jgi:hypothetical protein
MVGGCSPTNGFKQFLEITALHNVSRAAALIMPELKSSPEYKEIRPLNRHEVQAESKIFRSRIVVKSSCPY